MKRLGQGPIEGDVRVLRVLLGRCGLAQPSGWLPFAAYSVLPYLSSTSGVDPFAVTISRSCTIQYWYQSVHVATTNNASNYWSLVLRRMSDGAVIQTLTTSAISASTWSVVSATDMADALTAAHVGLYIRVTKVGGPGALTMAAPAMFVT